MEKTLVVYGGAKDVPSVRSIQDDSARDINLVG